MKRSRSSRFFWLGLATSGGIGYAPVAPGTFGTIPGVLLWYFLVPHIGLAGHILLVALVTALSVLAAAKAGPHFGEADAGPIVIDEVAGVLVAFLFVPHGVFWALAGFVLFRFFDIVKVWPASLVDRRMKNGLGVTLDDVVAGVYACLILNLAAFFLSRM